MPDLTIDIRDFRALAHLRWSPEGVCLLSGANGAGKTTTLDALKFLRALFTLDQEAAFRAVDGVAFRRIGADPDALVQFGLTVGELHWTLGFPMSARGLQGLYAESLWRGDQEVIQARLFDERWSSGDQQHPRDERRCCARVLWDRGESSWMRPLVDALEGLRVYDTYWLNQIKRVEPTNPVDTWLHPTGRNLWSVLANWKSSPLRYPGLFDWVLHEARRAFPELLSTIEFDRGLPYLFSPGATDPADGLLPNRAADGLLTGLLHLTAVAGARAGAVLAFDEMENHLHPHAIRSILAAMSARAEEHHLTILLTTHSPVLLNQFRHDPEQVFVLQRDPDGVFPARMTDLHDEDWLAQERLGTLYERLAFAAPDLTKSAP
jgi:predicted ATPase